MLDYFSNLIPLLSIKSGINSVMSYVIILISGAVIGGVIGGVIGYLGHCNGST